MLMDNKIPATEDLHVYRKKQQWSRGPIIVRSKLTFRRMKNISHNRASLCFDGKAKTSCVNNMLSTFVRFSSSGHTPKPLSDLWALKLIQNFITQTRIQN